MRSDFRIGRPFAVLQFSPGSQGVGRHCMSFDGVNMIVVGALLGYTVLFSVFIMTPLLAHASKPVGFILTLAGFIFGWFAIIGISINVDQHRSLRGSVIKKGFFGGMGVLRIWLGFMAAMLAVGIVLALTGH
jgi:hypothetical protein